MIPGSKPQATKETIIDMLIAQGLWNDRDLSTVVVVAVRGYYLNSMGKKNKNDRGIYDDAIFILAPNFFASFNSNTDPSRTRSGMAVLEAPQKVTYKPGYHGYGRKSGHPAFRQNSNVIVKRDGNRGHGKPLGNGRYTDNPSARFWINLHKGGYSTTSSAGCQTIPPAQWPDFYKLLRYKLKKHGQKTFNYYLLENK